MSTTPAFKFCKDCSAKLPLTGFYVSSSNTDGRVNFCPSCYQAKQKARYETKRLVADTTSEPKVCKACGQLKPADAYYRNYATKDCLQRFCKPCDNTRARAFNAANAESQAALKRARRKTDADRAVERRQKDASDRRHPERASARRAVRQAVVTGILVPQPCKHCGNEKSQAHHEDYNRPLDAIWVCDLHHRGLYHSDRYPALARRLRGTE